MVLCAKEDRTGTLRLAINLILSNVCWIDEIEYLRGRNLYSLTRACDVSDRDAWFNFSEKHCAVFAPSENCRDLSIRNKKELRRAY